jgi:hypothetical protein
MEARDELEALGRFTARQEQAHNPLSYPGEERHEVRELSGTRQQHSFEARAQALIDRIQALGQSREHGMEMS